MREYFKDNLILNLTFQFSLEVIEFVSELEKRKKFVIANQILRSGTAIGALAREAQNAESRADFIHKMKIAAKEADESEYWLLLCHYAQSYPECAGLMDKLTQVLKVLNKIIYSAKMNSRK